MLRNQQDVPDWLTLKVPVSNNEPFRIRSQVQYGWTMVNPEHFDLLNSKPFCYIDLCFAGLMYVVESKVA